MTDNPFMNLINNNKSNSIFGNNKNQSNSLFSNSNNSNVGQSSLFGTGTTTNTLFSNSNGGGGINFGKGLFGATTENNVQNETKTTISIFGNNPFSSGSNNNGLFSFNNNNKEIDKTKTEENSRKIDIDKNNENKFNFSSSFSLQNKDNNQTTNLFSSNNNINNNTGTLFGTTQNNNNTGTLFGSSNNNNSGVVFGAKDNKSNPVNQTSSNSMNKNNNTNTGFLFNNEKKDNVNFGNIFAPKENNTNNIKFGLFDSKGNNDKFETKKEEKTIVIETNKDNGIGLFSNNSFKNNTLFGQTNNNEEKPKTNNNEEKPKFGFFDNNKSNEENKSSSLFSSQINKKENLEKKIEINTSSNLFNNNNNYNPFFSNNKENSSSNNKNNFGNVFDSNITKNKETPKQNIFIQKENNNENIFLFNKKETSNNKNKKILFSSENKNDNNLFNNEITTNTSIFKNINNNIDNIDNINDMNNIDNMDVEEEIKDESFSSKSDVINNIWISDNEEIIDDDIDINKKIDYKKIEEKSKNIPNNINDLNLLIIPELSEYYFNLMKSADNNISYNSNLNNSICLSNKIIEILTQIIDNCENEEKKNELINITTIYIYFDAFILHRNDIVYLMRLRDELFYRYYMPIETVINMDKKNNEIYGSSRNNIESVINTLKHIYFYLTMLDISKANQKMMDLNRLYKDILRKKLLGDKTFVFNDLFLNIEKIIKIYNDIFNLKENFNSKQLISSFNMNSIFQDVKETIFNLQKDISINNNDENVKKIFCECQKICGMFAGEIKCIVNDYNRNDIHLIILGNIFYRFHLNDFIRGLQNCLNANKNYYDEDNNIVNKYILRIINNCDSNQIEIVQELKGNYPFLLRYHMIEILSQNNFLYHIENQEKYLKSEAFLLFQMFKDSKVPFKYYLNYFLFYPYYEIFTLDSGNDINRLPDDPSDDIKEEGYRNALDYALIYISFRFNNYDDLEELINEINEIKYEINKKIKNNYSNDIIYKINKLCLNKFIEKNIYKYSICYYIDNCKLEDFQQLQMHQIRKQLCAENDLNYDYPKQFDKVIINFYLNTNYLFNFNKFKEIYDNDKNQIIKLYNEYQELLKIINNKKNNITIDNNVIFMINYIEFLLDVIRYNLNKIEKNENDVNIVASTKKFFDNCFPLPKCPSFIWYHIVMLIKNVIDDNISLFNNDTFFDNENNICEQLFVWEKKLIYDLIKIEKMNNNMINYEESKKMYENAVTFINDITQGIYFNQNIFSNLNNNY